MADEPNQQEANKAPRVYKASEVHRRSATKRPRSKPTPAASSRKAQSSEPPVVESQREADAQPQEAAAQEPEVDQTKGQTQAKARARRQRENQEQPQDQEQLESQEQPQDQEVDEPQPKLWVRILKVVGLAIAALLLVSIGYIAADRWLIHNDQLGMIGEWHVANTTVPVVISDSTIKLNPETTYEYTIDTTAKTITYHFGDLQGQSHYWFSPDRKTLVLTDGKDFNAVGTLLDDVLHGIRDAFDNAFSGGATLPSGEGIIALTRA